MVALKKLDNDALIKYFLKVLEMLKNPMHEDKDLKKLLSLFKVRKILKKEEKKVIASPQRLPAQIRAPQGILESSILKL